MRRIAAAAAVGWGWIVWLGWSLADRRIDICGYGEEGCRLRATAARDAVLTHGLTVLLVGVVVAALLASGMLNRFRRRGGDMPSVSVLRSSMNERSREVWRSWRERVTRIDRGTLAIGAAIMGLIIAVAAGLDRSAAWVGLGQGPAPEATETAADPTDGTAWDASADEQSTTPKITPVDGNPFAEKQPQERSPSGTRNITVTFADGDTHIYQNAPDDVTPEQVTARAQREFGKTVTQLDGGRQP